MIQEQLHKIFKSGPIQPRSFLNNFKLASASLCNLPKAILIMSMRLLDTKDGILVSKI